MNFLKLVRMILWSFFGVRKKSGYDADLQTLKPHHIILVGLLAASVFIAIMLVFAKTAIHFLAQ